MKSLNRTLSLVLVLAMCLGLMGVAAATSFTDNTTIQYQTAVGTMVGMGAINGYTDGTFKPTGTITREEAAKMVTYAVLGADVAKTLTVSSTGFTDVASTRWSAPFITYLVSKGIVNGLGDGTFNPTGNVTGFELAKMLLCAAGYGKQGEYTGASWALNVAVDANSKGIFTGSKATSFSAAATREEAALYCFNAITKVVVVKYSKDDSSYSPVVADKTIAINTYGYSAQAAAAITAVTYNAIKGYTVATVGSYTIPADFSAVGTKVVVHGNTTTGKVFYVETTTKVLDLSNMTAAQYKAAVITAGLLTYSTATVPQYSNFYANGNYTLPTSATAFAYQDAKLITETNSTTGVTTVVAAQFRTRTVGAVSAVSAVSGAETLTVLNSDGSSTVITNATTNKKAFGDTVVKGDVVMLTSVHSGDAYVIEKAKTVTGAVSAVNVSAADGTYVTVNGASYFASTNNAASVTGYVGAAGITNLASGTASYNFYLDNFGDVIGYTGTTATATAYDLACVVAFGDVETDTGFGATTTHKYYAQVLFADGKYGTYEIASYNGKTVVAASATATQILYSAFSGNTYTLYNAVLDANGKVVLKDVATYGAGFTPAIADDTLTSQQIIKGNAIVGSADFATANTLYFYHAGTYGASDFVFYAFKGYANAPTMQATPTINDVATFTSNSAEYAAGIVYTGTPAEVATTDVYYYNGAYTKVTSGTTTTITYKLYKNGVAEDYAVTNTTAVPTINAATARGFYLKKDVLVNDTGLASFTTNVAMNQTMAGIASNILATATGVYSTVDTTVVVDLRTATQLAASNGAAVTSVAEIAAAKAAGFTLNFNVIYSDGSTLALDGSPAKPFIAKAI